MIAVSFASLVLQIFAVGAAIYLARNSKLGIGPILIIAALSLMLVRRSVIFFSLSAHFSPKFEELYKEWNALLVTVLIVTGLLLLAKAIGRSKKQIELDQIDRERLAAIINSSEDAIVTKDLQGTIQTWNASAERIFGYSAEEAIGKSITLIVSPDRHHETTNILEKIANGVRVEHLETERRKKNGEIIYISVTSSPIKDSSGKVIGATKIARDITQRKQQEARILESEGRFRALAEQKSKLLEMESGVRKQVEAANRIKDQFLATLSHELRTPLNAILGWSQILNRSGADPIRVSEGLRIIERNARSQAQIIEDLLDVNRIMSGNIHLDLQNLNLNNLIDESVDSVLPSAGEKEISIVTPKKQNPVFIKGDASRMSQIIWNLLTNAIKFTRQKGKIIIDLRSAGENIEIIVKDDGEGIDKNFLPHVFDRFSQADPSKTRKHGGLGLGLSIVKDLCELHNGTITVESEGIGAGSTFKVILPKLEANSSSIEKDGFDIAVGSQSLLSEMAILVVDDEEDSRDLVKTFLEGRQANVTVASSSQEALRKITENPFDLIISDISMPTEDGYQLIQKVRKLEDETKRVIPAIALTAFAKVEDKDIAFRSGFQAYVTKPLELNDLLTEITNLRSVV